MRRLTLTLTAVALFGATTGIASAVVPPPDPPVTPDQATRPRIETYSLVSPDARDAARKLKAAQHLAKTSGAPIVATADSGFSWGDAGVGAAGMLGLIAVVGGTLLLTTQHRRQRRHPFAAS
jgi:hypothetical protein